MPKEGFVVPQKRSCVIPIVAVSAVVLLQVGAIAHAEEPETLPISMVTTEEADHAYRSSGEMALSYPAAKVAAAMQDFSGYDQWAPRGQDGRDPASAGYIGQLTGTRFHDGFLDLIYRVNLFWPFGGSGQISRLAVTFPPRAPVTLTRIHFSLKDPSFAVLKLEGDFSLASTGPASCVVKFDSSTKFAWFLRPFFPLEAYRIHVVHRIETALRSFARQLQLAQN